MGKRRNKKDKKARDEDQEGQGKQKEERDDPFASSSDEEATRQKLAATKPVSQSPARAPATKSTSLAEEVKNLKTQARRLQESNNNLEKQVEMAKIKASHLQSLVKKDKSEVVRQLQSINQTLAQFGLTDDVRDD